MNSVTGFRHACETQNNAEQRSNKETRILAVVAVCFVCLRRFRNQLLEMTFGLSLSLIMSCLNWE